MYAMRAADTIGAMMMKYITLRGSEGLEGSITKIVKSILTNYIDTCKLILYIAYCDASCSLNVMVDEPGLVILRLCDQVDGFSALRTRHAFVLRLSKHSIDNEAHRIVFCTFSSIGY